MMYIYFVSFPIEQITKVKYERIPTLKATFKHPTDSSHVSTITAANASPMSDGAAAIVLCSGRRYKQYLETLTGQSAGPSHKPIARIRAIADAEVTPIDFPVAPAKAILLACQRYVKSNN